MRKLSYGLLGLCLCLLFGCEKNNCQTSLQGHWNVYQHPAFRNVIVDSVIFYKADSLYEAYRTVSTDTIRHYFYNSLYINDNCNEIDFLDTIVLGGAPATKFDILFLDTYRFDLRSKANAGCDSCIISLRK
jgi:hypothetical protein